MFRHLKDNKGDANVSKMTLIAIVFVVGAILLVLVTSAFRNPINRWFTKVSNDWFAGENGEFNLMIDPYESYERNANGTYQGLKYICYNEDGSYAVFDSAGTCINGDNGRDSLFVSWYNADGSPNMRGICLVDGNISISPDGKTITHSGDVYEAQLPNK